MNFFKQKELDYVYSGYILGFLAFISLISIVPIRGWMPDGIYDFCYFLFLGLGCVLILHDILTEKYMFRSSLWWTLLLCVGIMTINVILNRENGDIVTGIKYSIWALELVALCYPAYARLEKKGLSKVMIWAMNIVVFIHSMAALVSVAMALYGIETTIVARGVKFIQGLCVGRLWGVYMSAGESSSVICIALILFFIGRWNKWYQKLYYVLCLIVNYYSFLLENARACEVAMLAASACVAWIIGRGFLHNVKAKVFMKEGLAVLLAFTCVAGVYFMNWGCRNLAYHSIGVLADEKEDLVEGEIVLQRELVVRDSRIDIWKSFISAYSREMRPFGYSKVGYDTYLKEHYPEYFTGIEGLGPHNTYIDTLCRAGWIGLLLLFVWIIYHMVRCVQYIIKYTFLRREEIGAIAVVIIMLVVGIFQETTFWTFSFPEVMIFWLIVGELTFILKKERAKALHSAP